MPKVLLKTDQLENFSKSGKCLKLEKKIKKFKCQTYGYPCNRLG